jgi:hypothetical protein
MVPMGYLWARGKPIHEKNLKWKVSCQTPFKNNTCTEMNSSRTTKRFSLLGFFCFFLSLYGSVTNEEGRINDEMCRNIPCSSMFPVVFIFLQSFCLFPEIAKGHIPQEGERSCTGYGTEKFKETGIY